MNRYKFTLREKHVNGINIIFISKTLFKVQLINRLKKYVNIQLHAKFFQ